MKNKFWMYAVTAIAVASAVLPVRADVTPEQQQTLSTYLKQGEQLQQTGKWGDAIDNWTKMIAWGATIPDAPPALKAQLAVAYRNRALGYSQNKDWKKAVADFGEALKINPQDTESLIGRGEADSHFNVYLGDVKEEPAVNPLDDFAAAMQLDPHSGHAYVARGIYNRGGIITNESLQKALPDFEKAIQVDPTYADGWYWRGQIRQSLAATAGDALAAKSDYDHAIALTPRAEYFAARAQWLGLQASPDLPAMLADYTSAIQYDAENPAYYTKRVAVQALLPTPDKAQMLADYSQAIKLLKAQQELAFYSDDDASMEFITIDLESALEKRGDMELENGDGHPALDDYNAALKEMPTSIGALAGRTQIMLLADQPELAVQEISARMASVRKDNEESRAASLFGARGQAFVTLNRFDEALLDLNQAIKFDSLPGIDIYSQKANWYFWRAVAWQGKGDDAHALADLNVAAQLNPAVIGSVKGTKFEKDLKPHAPDKSVIIENGDTAMLHQVMGNEWLAAGAPANAGGEYDKAIALDANFAAPRAGLVLIRAIENHAPTQAELDAAFTTATAGDLHSLLLACDTEITRHPETAALKDLRAAVVAKGGK